MKNHYFWKACVTTACLLPSSLMGGWAGGGDPIEFSFGAPHPAHPPPTTHTASSSSQLPSSPLYRRGAGCPSLSKNLKKIEQMENFFFEIFGFHKGRGTVFTARIASPEFASGVLRAGAFLVIFREISMIFHDFLAFHLHGIPTEFL